MIIPKAALNIVNICAPDRNNRALCCVCIERDGSCVAMNNTVYGWVSPLSPGKAKLVPLDNSPLRERVILSVEGVNQIIKAIPQDKQFKGLLEHCDIAEDWPGTPGIIVTITDGKQRHGIELRRIGYAYPDYVSVFREIWQESKPMFGLRATKSKICLNRRRISNICMTADKVCNYDGQFAPMLWYVADDGRVIMRTVNELNGQRLVMLMMASEAEFVDLDEAEMRLLVGRSRATKIN